MSSNPTLRGLTSAAPALLACALVLALAGCASSAGPAAPRTTVRVDPVPAPRDATAPASDAPLPALTASTGGDVGNSVRRVQNLDMVNQQLPTVLRSLAESFGLGHQIDPSVHGQVSLRLTDVTLEQALDALVQPYGYAYQIEGNVLRVVPARLETRMFALDYVSLSRVGTSSTVVQRSFGGGNASGSGNFGGAGGAGGVGGGGIGGGVGGGGGGGGGGSSITSVTVADLWEGIRVALEGLIFDAIDAGAGSTPAGAAGTGTVATQPGSGAGGPSGGGGRATGASSRSAGGRRLIIDPFAGVITVTAPPETLADVAAYITTIERSVQRQVIIEAKIVEVLLDRSFEFGIDWSFVRRVAGVNLRIGGGQSGAEFTIESPGADSDGTISIVLNALESQGDVSVLSSPRVSVLNNQPAAFTVTRDDVFFSVTRQPILGPNGGTIGFNTEVVPQQISVGITLDVLAQISPDNVITMNVRPVVTDVISEKTVQLEDGTQASAPVIDRRETDTMVRVRGGETVVIGGLMQTRQANRDGGVPGLRSIPGIGRLFGGVTRETEKRELVIFITPRIVAGQAQTGD